jgi:hypothetical protein
MRYHNQLVPAGRLGLLVLCGGLLGGCPLPMNPGNVPGDDDADPERLPNPVFDRILSNQRPQADAGSDQTVAPGQEVILNGSGSRDPDRDQLFFIWTQIGGAPTVEFNVGPASAIVRFVAPEVSAETALTFSLTVGDGFATDVAQVVISIVP